MDITTGFIHILNDWKNTSNRVNDVLRYNFQINGCRIALSYTKVNGLENQISITWFLNNHGIILSFDIKKNEDRYDMSTYIPNEYFNEIRGSFNFNEDKPVNSFMTTIFTRIQSIPPISYDFNQYNHEFRAMHYHNDVDKPFFECFIRMNISEKMQQKIWRKYSNAAEIISFCRKNNKTLRFTQDITRAKKFSVEFEHEKISVQ